MFFVKSASIMGAASLISLGAAVASEPDDLFTAGLLELNEKPMSANELGEARGGFRFGGLDFNIGIQVLPPTFNPLPDGPFGGNGGPFGSNGGPFGQNGGPFGNNGNHNNNSASQNNTPSAPQSVAQNTPAASSQQPAAQQPTTVASAAPSTSAPSAPAASSTPAATTTPTPPAATAANTSTTSAPTSSTPPAAVANTSPASATNNNTQTASNSTPAPSTPYMPLPTPGSSSTDASQGDQDTSSSSPPPEVSSPAPSAVPAVPESRTQYSIPLGKAVSTGNGNSGKNSPPVSPPATISATLKNIDEPKGIRGIESNGLSSVINNTLNNVFISQEVVMNVQVTNYDFAMSMRRVSNVTSQAVSQSFFLPGLN
ncbi:hypothetical protein ACFOOP_10060 [Marinicaulis aureus]|uniref:hypothetical protein n=1 Tax=Hyphococcus aureus TaxID=2666033 RepID=UPI00361EEA4E